MPAALAWQEGGGENTARGELLDIGAAGRQSSWAAMPPLGIPARLRVEARDRRGGGSIRLNPGSSRLPSTCGGRTIGHLQFVETCPAGLYELVTEEGRIACAARLIGLDRRGILAPIGMDGENRDGENRDRRGKPGHNEFRRAARGLGRSRFESAVGRSGARLGRRPRSPGPGEDFRKAVAPR